MKSTGSATAIHIAGACILGICALCSVWLCLVRASETRKGTDELRTQIGNARTDMLSLQTARQKQEENLNRLKAQLGEKGVLPASSPVEAYLQDLANEAARFQLQVRSQRPLPGRTYPGLVEQRYHYEIEGEPLNVIRFFSLIESTNYWCDVSFFSLEGPGDTNKPAVASLTLSLFSAPVMPTDRLTPQPAKPGHTG